MTQASKASRFPPATPLLMKLVLSLFTLGGLFFAVMGAWTTWEMSRQLATARETVGIVRSTKVEAERSTDSSTGRTTTHHVPVIEYEYHLDGATFTSTRIYPGGMLIRGPGEENFAVTRRLLHKHPAGTQVAVWYLPQEPETSFLKPVRRTENGLMLLVGATLAAVGLGLLLPAILPAPTVRLACAATFFLLAQSVSWLVWSAFLVAPQQQLSSSPALLRWMLVAYVLICWAAVVAHVPPRWRKLRDATFVSLFCGILAMSLSIFVLLPLTAIAPELEALHALPWIGVVAAGLALILGMFGKATMSQTTD